MWDIDRTGERPARTLIGGFRGLGGVAHLLDGTLIFTSTSADPGCGPDADNENAWLWAPPPEGAAASVVATRPGGVDSFRVAHGSGLVVLASKTFPSSTNVESERSIRRERTAGKVTATLHDALPVRWWDADLGPDTPRLYAGTPRSDRRTELKDLTPHASPALITLLWEAFDVSPDGSTVATPWAIPERGGLRVGLALVDVASASTRLALDDPRCEFGAPRFSPDSRRVAVTMERRSTVAEPPDVRLGVLDVDTGELRDISGGWDRWPAGPVAWTPDGSALVLVA